MDKNYNSGGVGITGLLGVVFIALKLTGSIKWSWWWVTAPFWIPAVIVCAVLGVCLILNIITRK